MWRLHLRAVPCALVTCLQHLPPAPTPSHLPSPPSPGFANLENVNLTSERNLFILGFGLYTGLSVPDYFEQYTAANGHGPVDTASGPFNDIMNSLFSTPAAVALMATMLLDLTIPAAPGERSQEAWQQQG